MLLKNGTIYDGSQNPPFVGSISIENDKIVKIYKEKDPLGKQSGKIIDCTGLVITPGFIDAHSHNDFFAAREDKLTYFEPFVRQGVTTMVTGNCGFSAAGYKEKSPFNNLIGGGLFSNGGNDYSNFKSWAKAIDQTLPVNILSLVGHGTMRIGINGKKNNDLSEKQLLEMDQILEKTLSSGAAGVSFGLMYEPGQYAPFEELERVAKIVKKYGKIVTFHARACSKVSTSYTPPIGGRAHNLRAMDEVIKITKNTGVKTEYSHLIFVGKNSWGTVDESLKLLEDCVKDGLDISFDMYPMEFGASVITVILPTWYLGLSDAKKHSKLIKLRLALEILMARKALGFGFQDILIANTYGVLKEIEGKRIPEIAKSWKMNNLDTYLEIINRTNGKVNVLMYQYQNKAIIERLRQHPLSLYMTDAWIEEGASVQNYACYYAFPKFLLLAKNNQTDLSLAIHKMTQATAKKFNIPNRGSLQEGFFADIAILDLNKLSYKENICESPQGIEYVINNGKIIVDHQKIDETNIKVTGRFISI